MNKPLVSICIPTYNRAIYLEKSLNSIVQQKEFISGEVEIIISDNASIDKTSIVGNKYASKYNNCYYHYNTENVRDKNYPFVLSYGSGVLRKLCNDTLLFKEGSLKKLCDIVRKYQDVKPLLFFHNKKCGFVPLRNTDVLDFETFLKNISYNITWIGAFSIWDVDCQGIENDTQSCDMLLWQVQKSCDLLSKKNAAVIITDKLVDVQIVAKKDISYGLYQVFYINYFFILNKYIESGNVSQATMNFLKKDLLYKFYTDWIIQWELKNKKLQYSDEENLKILVFDQYKDELYFKHYLKYYRLVKIKTKIKNLIKTILRK